MIMIRMNKIKDILSNYHSMMIREVFFPYISNGIFQFFFFIFFLETILIQSFDRLDQMKKKGVEHN